MVEQERKNKEGIMINLRKLLRKQVGHRFARNSPDRRL